MNLGKDNSVSAPRRAFKRQFGAMGIAVAVGVFGLAGVRSADSRADAVSPSERPESDGPAPFPYEWAVDWPAVAAAAVELPIPPRFLATPPMETTTTTVAPEPPATTEPPAVETTATSAPPAPPVTSTTTPPAPASPTRPRVAASGPEAQAQVEAIADSTGWNWRAAGVRFRTGFYPGDCCHWGVYEAATSIIWVGPTAFADPNRLRYVVLHELAHGWQYRQNRFAEIISDYSAWGFGTIGPALEAGADCLASVWGAAGSHYWRCTGPAKALASRRLAGDWR
jgi:hypothetical protein